MRGTTVAFAGALGLGLLLAGCLPDLGPWTVVDGTPLPDGAIVRRDAGSTPPAGQCDPPVTCPGDCPLPWLLAAVQDLGDDCGGRVWRWSITSRDELCACGALDADGAVPRLPFAVGFVPPETVVVGGDTRAVAIDARTDRELWSEPLTGRAVDVFPITDAAGIPRAAVAESGATSGDVRAILFFDAASGGTPERRVLNGDLPLGLSVPSVTLSPYDRRWLRALKPGSYAAADVDPIAGVRMEDPLHTRDRAGFFLHTIDAGFDGTFHRTVWTGERTDTTPRRSELYRLAVGGGDPGDHAVPLGERCVEGADALPYDVTCTYTHATWDPTLNTTSFAICEHAPGQRRLVRVRFTNECRTVVEQTAVHPNARIWQLAIAQASYWE